MKNFGRVLRLAARSRLTLAGVIVSALSLSILWGGNVGTIYPFIEILLRGRSLDQWASEELAKADRSVAEYADKVDQVRHQIEASAGNEATFQRELDRAERRLEAEQKAANRYRLIQPYIHDYLPHDAFQSLAVFLGVVLVGTLIKNLCQMANMILVARVSYLTGFRLQKQFLARMLRLDVATFTNDGASEFLSRFTYDMQNVVQGVSVLFGKLIREPLKMVVCLVAAGLICWRLLILSLVIVPLAGWAIRWLAKMLKRSSRKAMEEMANLHSTLSETFQGIKVVKAFTMERQERQRFHQKCKKYFKKQMKIARYDSMTHPVTELMGIMIICLAMLAGCYLVLRGQTHLLGIRMSMRPLGPEELVLFYAMLVAAADPARKLSDVFTQLQAGVAAADRIYAVLDREPVICDPPQPQRLPRHGKELVFENVGFAYEPGRPVLHEINLRLRFGETLAIVGPSGCGKSTLANLIPRFADPTAGEIRVDGIPLSDVRLRDLRGQIGLVTQDPLLFDDTVLANIRYGSPHAGTEEVIAAAKQAHAHRFIEQELPDGYDTELGPMGGQLSGGQRQRISLARAILRDPSILILDEATSQIDLESENLIQKVLERFAHGRTTVIITHRLGLLALADRIAVMQDGRILDLGTHHELLGRCELYRRLYEIQFDGLKQSA